MAVLLVRADLLRMARYPEQEFGIARGTARKAIALLREEGLIVTVKGRGSYVRPPD